MTDPRPATPHVADYALLLLLATIWGSSFMLINVAVSTIPAAWMTAIRLVFAAVFMIGVMAVTGARLPSTRSGWLLAVLIALFGNAIPFTLISWGQERIDSGLAAILMGVMPLTTVGLAHLLVADDKLNVPKAIGIVLGLAGVVTLVGPEKLLSLGEQTVRELAVAAAAVCYGISAVITRILIGDGSRFGLAAAIMSIAALLMAPVAFVLDPGMQFQPSGVSLAAAAVLGVLQSAVGQLMLFLIVSRRGASFFSQINYLVPVIGVLWATFLLGEQLGAAALVALGLILSGVAVARLGTRGK